MLSEELTDLLNNLEPGDKLKLDIERIGQENEVKVIAILTKWEERTAKAVNKLIASLTMKKG